MAGALIKEVAEVKIAPMQVALATCTAGVALRSKPATWFKSPRAVSAARHLCGNEETIHPPLTEVTARNPVLPNWLVEGTGAELTWAMVEKRNAFLVTSPIRDDFRRGPERLCFRPFSLTCGV